MRGQEEIIGGKVEVDGEEVGPVAALLIEELSWTIRYLVALDEDGNVRLMIVGGRVAFDAGL